METMPTVQDELVLAPSTGNAQAPVAAEPASENTIGSEPIAGIPPPAATSAVPPDTPAEPGTIAERNTAGAEDTPAAGTVEEPTSTNRTWNAVNATEESRDRPAAAPKPRKLVARRRAKAVTLRNIEEDEEEAMQAEENGDTPVVAPKPRKPRRRAKAVTLRNIEEEEEEEARRQAEEGYVPPPPKRSSAKARGKRKAADSAVGNGDDTVQPPAKKARQPRKPKAKAPTFVAPVRASEPSQAIGDGQVAENGQAEGNAQTAENGENSENAGESARPDTTRKRKRQTTSQSDDAAEGEEGETQPKRRGRRAREPTPPDAENDVIDEGEVFMDDISRGRVRTGKVSNREKKMRTINWDEVRQRQKERAAEAMNSRARQAELERELQEKYAAREERARQLQMVMVDGQIQYVEGPAVVEEEEPGEIVEYVEDDFTSRINRTSFMRNNKRYPEELMLPGQGKQWDIRSTADFYEALKMFGTDFGMMLTLFPGVNRRSLKRKFNREERDNPEAIKRILQDKNTRLSDWDRYLRESGREEAAFDKVEQIKREMEEMDRKNQEEIEKAKAKAADEREQRRLAGVLTDDDEAEGQNEAGKKKKGKKGKEKQVTSTLR